MEAVQALSQGKIDAVIIDNEPAKNFVVAKEGLKILDGAYTEIFTGEKYGKGKQEFLLWPGSYVVLTK